MAFIYKIIDQKTEEVKYVGNTTLPLNIRLNKHLTKARTRVSSASIHAWMRESLANNSRPRIELIMEVDDKDASESELILIQAFKLVGHPLLNSYKMH